MLPGEVLIRGKSKSSVLFKNDGTTIFKLDDDKEETDPDNTIIKIESNGDITISNANNVTTNCKNATINAEDRTDINCTDAKVTATTVEIESDNITLGKTGSLAPIIRDTDKTKHTDPVIGVPVFSEKYMNHSNTTRAK
jgi:hypothetical protein